MGVESLSKFFYALISTGFLQIQRLQRDCQAKDCQDASKAQRKKSDLGVVNVQNTMHKE